MAVKLSVLVFCVTPCGLIGRYHCFRETYCLGAEDGGNMFL
jgi:hypothetical protein